MYENEVDRKQERATLISDVIEVEMACLDVSFRTVEYLKTLLSAQELDRADRFALGRERRRFIVARATLRCMLGQRLQIRPEQVELVYGKRGKPALAPGLASSSLRFNVSHHREFAIYAFTSGREVGIDIEEVRHLPDADDIADFIFSPHEREMYNALDARDKARGFFNCWTRKEAFIKALGAGLSYPLGSFDVSLAPDEPAQFLQIRGAPDRGCGWRLHAFEPRPGLVAAVAAPQNDDLQVTFHRMNLSRSTSRNPYRYEC